MKPPSGRQLASRRGAKGPSPKGTATVGRLLKFKVTIQGSSVTLTPNKQRAGFVLKGRAAVFSTNADQKLEQATLRSVLEEGRAERDERDAGDLTGRK